MGAVREQVRERRRNATLIRSVLLLLSSLLMLAFRSFGRCGAVAGQHPASRTSDQSHLHVAFPDQQSPHPSLLSFAS